MFSAAVGAAPATLAHIVFRSFQLSNGVALSQSIVFGASVCSGVRVLSSAPPKLCISWSAPIAIPHSIAFLSNSYTSWEDRAMPIFLLVTLVPPVLTALSAPTARLQYRILAFSSLFATCVRLTAVSTVCREEQHPWYSVTFFSGSGAAESPILVCMLPIPATVLVPYGVRRVLAISKSDNGIASLLLPYIVPPAARVGSSNRSTRPAHTSTPNTWTRDGRVLYSPGPACSLPSVALRSGRSFLSHCTYPRSRPPRGRSQDGSSRTWLRRRLWRSLCRSLGAYPGTCLARGAAKRVA